MFINLTPEFGRDFWIGDVFWSREPGAFLGDNIAMDTYPELVKAGKLVASHTGIIVSPTHVVEAWWPRVRRWPIAAYTENPESFFWVMRPLGQTQASAQATGRFAADLVGDSYDGSAILGLALSDQDDKGTEPNPLADQGEWICSRLVDVALRVTEASRTVPLPESFKRTHPTWRTPHGLFVEPIWQPADGLPPA